MKKNQSIFGGETSSSLEITLAVESFLNENYLFRRNILSGKVEVAEKTPEGLSPYRPFTMETLNSIVRKAKKEQVCEKGSPKTEIQEFIYSEDVPLFDPIGEYLGGLPEWDGVDRITQLFNRIPGLTPEHHGYFRIWVLSTVAHWLQLDMLHGNECVPTLIGAQGCGKTTFFNRLLPPSLRQYQLDHLNLSNKFDKEMALTNNLIVNLDELEAIRPSQHAALKQLLSKNKVNGRPIYGMAQQDRPRYASFVATTNNPQPLTDPTGSRRFICYTIPDGQFIDNSGEIDHDQLYAQVVYELKVARSRYWFTNEEVARLQELNQNYVQVKDIAKMVKACFRKPHEGEKSEAMNPDMLLQQMRKDFPTLQVTHGNKVQLGKEMNRQGFASTDRSNVQYYSVIPLNAA